MRPVIRMPIAKPARHWRTLTGNIEISGDNIEIAQSLEIILSAQNLSVKIVDRFTPSVTVGILTTGLRTSDKEQIHWDSLSKARDFRLANGSKLFILDDGFYDQNIRKPMGWEGSLSGLAKTAAREWEDISVQAIRVPFSNNLTEKNVAGKSTTRELAEQISEALFISLPEIEIHPDGSLRKIQLGQKITPSVQSNQMQKDVWLITGGARGVTASCIKDIAARAGGRFLLLGRSEITPWPAGIEKTTDIKTLRTALAQQIKIAGERPNLKTINQLASQALAGEEVRKTLYAIRKTGANATYYACDITDAEKTIKVLDNIISEHGSITGLVHGAGVLADRFITDISKAELEKIFSTKISGLKTILEHIDIGNLRRVALFSSAAARYGNVGQSAYAMANEVLNKVAYNLYTNFKHVNIKSFNWGPWAGGMVDESLAEHFEAQNIALIPLQIGAHIFSDQMLYGDLNQVELLVGDAWTAE